MVKKKESDIGLSLLLGNYDDILDKDMVSSLGGIGNKFGFGFMDEEKKDDESDDDSLISDEEYTGLEQDASFEEEYPAKFVLSVDDDENPLLRFSELFGAKEQKKNKHKAFNMKGLIQKMKDHAKVTYNLEDGDDDEDLFFENDIRVDPSTKLTETASVDQSSESAEDEKPSSVNYLKQSQMDIISQRCSVENVDQVNWEENIVWDLVKLEDKESKKQPEQTTPKPVFETNKSSILGLNTIFSSHKDFQSNKINEVPDLSGIPKLNTKQEGAWGEIAEKSEETKPKDTSKSANTETKDAQTPSATSNTSTTTPLIKEQEPNPSQPHSTDLAESDPNFPRDESKKPKRKYTRRKKKEREEEEESKFKNRISTLRKVTFDPVADDYDDEQVKFLNEQLMNGDWMDDIYWDEYDASKKQAKNTKLIIDMNDKSMFFNESDGQSNVDKDEIFDTIEYNIYNISNDSKYEGQTIKDQSQKTTAKKYTVRHSQPALKLDPKLYRSYIPDNELRRHHHRKNKFKNNEIMTVVFRKPKKEKKKSKKRKDIEKKQDLSANDHRVILMEYVEERPSLLNNVGMGTMIMNYYKKPNSAFDSVPECEDGIPIVVESEDGVPLINTLVDGEFFTTTENNMFRAQIFKQEVKSTDFLLCTRKASGGKTKFYIREIPREYVVGHTQPQVEVTPPRTRASESYTNNRLTLFIYRSFLDQMKKGKKQLKIKIDDIKEAFPDFPHQTIRERLKALATYDRGSGVWTAHPSKPIPSEEELQNLVSPEMVCINESMLSGDLRLNDKGIDDEASMVAFELSFARVEEKYRDTIRFIEREKIELPWDKTNNFHLCFKGGKEGVKLQLLGVIHQNITNPDKLKQLVEETEKRIQSEIEEILPSMTDTEAKRILINNKYTEDQLKNMTRADRKMNARKILKQQGYQPGVEYVNRETLFDINTNSAMDNTNGAMDNNAIDSRKNAKDIARINIFKEVLQDVYFREAIKLQRGLNFYETPDDIIDKLVEQKLGRSKADKEELDKLMNSSIQQKLKEMDEAEAETGKKKRGRKSKQPSVVEIGKRYVKKTTFIANDDGTQTEKVELIKNPTQVSYYELVSKGKRRAKHFLGATEEEVLLVGPRERGRLQALSREFKKKFRSDKHTASEKLNQDKKKKTTAIKNASVTTTRKQQTKQKKLKREQKKEEEIQKKEKRAAIIKKLDISDGTPIISDKKDKKKKKERSEGEKKRKSTSDSGSSKKKTKNEKVA
ncbi:predicted protein [Naegleria gruberi]|uniref:Predicted protein n=1 Tax=Naegleria gruberi TaxID=5762 RepID=D2VY94_NAEGR|nr:uncharacterized protein NAEGRDRAFT_81689 [Naegleria gruberi]EFC38161.1 predicted protein [Naegleria gruberi]|eukprot:XP_002670905.1 predicted protein [Naegleria gruberi strain NEG-M]